MPTELASTFRAELNSLHDALLALSPALADAPWRAKRPGVNRAFGLCVR